MSATMLILAIAGIASAAAGSSGLEGKWAGDRLIMTVRPDGATINSDCARGAINQPLHLDRHLRFSATGTFTADKAGPQKADEAVRAIPSTFRGQLAGDTLDLSIEAEGQELRKFKLQRGGTVKLVRCL